MALPDGTPLTPALGIGAFADKTAVHEVECTSVDPAADPQSSALLPAPLPACRHRVQGRPSRPVPVGIRMKDRFDLRVWTG